MTWLAVSDYQQYQKALYHRRLAIEFTVFLVVVALYYFIN